MSTPTTTPPTRNASSVAGALKFFEIMAFVVGVGLLVLVVELILRYGFGNHALDWWPQPHGFLYIGYVVATANLDEGFRGVNWALLVGSVPRKQGMERRSPPSSGPPTNIASYDHAPPRPRRRLRRAVRPAHRAPGA